MHGGIGYTWEHDLHLFLRHAYGSEHWMGTTDWHHDRLADLLFACDRRWMRLHRIRVERRIRALR